jgi:hypothetical protein
MSPVILNKIQRQINLNSPGKAPAMYPASKKAPGAITEKPPTQAQRRAYALNLRIAGRIDILQKFPGRIPGLIDQFQIAIHCPLFFHWSGAACQGIKGGGHGIHPVIFIEEVQSPKQSPIPDSFPQIRRPGQQDFPVKLT